MESGCSKFKAGTGQMDAAAAAATIMPRWAKLIGEYEALRDALREHTRQPHWPGVAPYIAMLKTEASFAAKTLEAERRKVEEGLNDEESTPFAVSQALTNIAARETMWRLIKTSPQGGLVALERKFPRKPPTTSVKAASQQYRRWGSVSGMHASGSRASDGVFVNAVLGNGFEWLRVLTLTTPQLLVSMAENGWEWGEGSDDENEESDAAADLEAIADIPLVATILGLVDVARDNRSRGAYPHICVILTRVEEDDPSVKGADEVARFLRVLRGGLAALASTLDRDIDGRRLAVTVHTARSPRALAQPGDNSLARLMPDLAHQLTPTLNIDTSILIALASDISHQAVAVRRWFPHQRVDEIAHERARPGQMLQGLCAAMRGRRLVCTREAARAFRTMVRDMGQAREKARAAVLIFGGEDESESSPPQAALVERYRALSQHAHYVPDDLLLPIRVIDEAWDMARIQKEADNAAAGPSHMPAVAYRVAQEMNASVPTLSVFFYGWASGHATLTTNSTARNKILRLLEKHRSSSRQQGPHVRLCRPVRSLNGTNPRGCDDDDDDDDDEADEACGPSYD